MPPANDAAHALHPASASHALPVQLNGAPHALAAPTIDAALHALGLSVSAKHLAVAVNDAVVPRTQWVHTVLHARDRVEIITAVAGG